MKLTDKEVIKVLECCASGKNCEECSLNCKAPTSKDILDLINRYEAEIERLNKAVDALTQRIMEPFHEEREKWIELEKEFTTKAIKEFWGKLKSHSRKMQSSDFSGEFWDRAVLVEDGDNLEKAMVGEQV